MLAGSLELLEMLLLAALVRVRLPGDALELCLEDGVVRSPLAALQHKPVNGSELQQDADQSPPGRSAHR